MSSRQRQRQTAQLFWKFKLVAWFAIVDKLFDPPYRHPVWKTSARTEMASRNESAETYMLLCVSAKRS